MLLFCPGLLLHVSRPVRWDSDHVVILDDELEAIARELVRSGKLDRIHVGLDYFDASINRVAAWIIGARNMMKALLIALLEPTARLREIELAQDFTQRLALLEELKSLPWSAVWDYYCAQKGVPGRHRLVRRNPAIRTGRARETLRQPGHGGSRRLSAGIAHETNRNSHSGDRHGGRCPASSRRETRAGRTLHLGGLLELPAGGRPLGQAGSLSTRPRRRDRRARRARRLLWNHDGWTDPFSSAQFSRRQERYAEQFGIAGPYTPQLVVDGASELNGSDGRGALSAIGSAARTEKLAVRVLRSRGGVRVEVDPGSHGGDVYLALAQNAGTSQVLRGENQGRSLQHVAIVRRLSRIGSFKSRAGFAKDVPLSAGESEYRGIAFVQDSGPGHIWGAAMLNPQVRSPGSH